MSSPLSYSNHPQPTPQSPNSPQRPALRHPLTPRPSVPPPHLNMAQHLMWPETISAPSQQSIIDYLRWQRERELRKLILLHPPQAIGVEAQLVHERNRAEVDLQRRITEMKDLLIHPRPNLEQSLHMRMAELNARRGSGTAAGGAGGANGGQLQGEGWRARTARGNIRWEGPGEGGRDLGSGNWRRQDEGGLCGPSDTT